MDFVFEYRLNLYNPRNFQESSTDKRNTVYHGLETVKYRTPAIWAKLQKQPSRGAPKKRCFENMQLSNFIEIAFSWVFSCCIFSEHFFVRTWGASENNLGGFLDKFEWKKVVV